ncbi:copper resistance protein CopC, partial [Actinotalea sp. M2MS4P-6]|nr:copper resistance protein CopC [Actinotalea sp. M2MS4P-6]
MSTARGRARRAAVALAAAAALLGGATPALAHSELEHSDPPDGGMVAVGRTSLSLWFTEAVISDATTVERRPAGGGGGGVGGAVAV